MEKPLLFISHKHDDKKIAKAVADFVRTLTAGRVAVHLSSDKDYEGPSIGKPINDQLRQALYRADVFVLVYTSMIGSEGDLKDWQYCMWECGLAEDPATPRTEIVVMQCFEEGPKVFQEKLQVRSWDKDSLISFARRFRDADFFPKAMDEGQGAMTALEEREVDAKAVELYETLQKLIVPLHESWPVWKFARLRLDQEAMGKTGSEAVDTIVQNAQVVKHSPGFPALFGVAQIPSPAPFAHLVERWQARDPQRSREWLEVVTQQMLESAQRYDPVVKHWPSLRAAGGDYEYLPVVTWVRKGARSLSFDVCFVRHMDVPPATSRMNRVATMYSFDLSKKDPHDILLQQLLADLEDRSWTRVPILKDGKAAYVVHASMIDRFVRKRAFAGAHELAGLTLADLLAEKDMKEMFAKTFVFISETATMADARAAIGSRPGVEDAFVTESGSDQDLVLGWLTDRDIAGALDAS